MACWLWFHKQDITSIWPAWNKLTGVIHSESFYYNNVWKKQLKHFYSCYFCKFIQLCGICATSLHSLNWYLTHLPLTYRDLLVSGFLSLKGLSSHECIDYPLTQRIPDQDVSLFKLPLNAATATTILNRFAQCGLTAHMLSYVTQLH